VPLIQSILWSPDESEDALKGSPMMSMLLGMAGRPTRIMGYLLIALITYQHFFPPWEDTKVFAWSWISLVVLRNIAIMLIFYGGWHIFLYGGPNYTPLLAKLRPKKFNPHKVYNIVFDFVFCLQGYLILSAYECVIMHLMATGYIRYYTDFWKYPVWSLAQCVFVPYWIETHFYFTHRFLHIPFLYRNVHYFHHKARSPGPFSGLSMHPIEHLIFFSSVFTPFFMTLHPIHFLFVCTYARISPLAGHDGYDKPCGGSLIHYLHHVKVNVNYGTPVVPFDKWFGTYDDGTEWREQQKQNALKAGQ